MKKYFRRRAGDFGKPAKIRGNSSIFCSSPRAKIQTRFGRKAALPPRISGRAREQLALPSSRSNGSLTTGGGGVWVGRRGWEARGRQSKRVNGGESEEAPRGRKSRWIIRD